MRNDLPSAAATATRALAAAAVRFLAAFLLAPMLALAQPATAAKPGPRLANLEIEIWPEYDRAGAVLVILKGELAKDAALPATVSLRLPVASGGPTAVAYARTPGETPLNLAYDRDPAADAITIRFTTPERNFHVELYEPVATALPARTYTYHWQGDLATDQLVLLVQEPATSAGLETQPKTDLASTGQDGLRYHAARLGPQASGQRLPMTVRYTKTDLRTSVAILKPNAPVSAPAAAPAAPASAGAPFPALVIVLSAVAALAIAGMAAFIVLRRRAASNPELAHGACTKCGAARRAGDRFCGKCGAMLGDPGQ